MRGTAMVALAVLVAAGCSGDRSLPTGEVYRSIDHFELAVRPDHQVELKEGKNSRYLGSYSIEDDGRMRVVVEVLGTQKVLYFEQDPEVGLVTEEGRLLYNPKAKAHVDNLRAQAQTMAVLRTAGTAMIAWVADAVGAAAPGYDVDLWPLTPTAEIRRVLVPTFLATLPTDDGWGHPLEYRLRIDDPLGEYVMFVRSPGSDGEFDSDSYQSGAYDPDETTRDIVWGDGYFISWPERP